MANDQLDDATIHGGGDPAPRSPADGNDWPDDVDRNFEQSLEGLSRLATGRLDLEDLLTRVAEFATKAVPGSDGAGLTLIEPDRTDTVVATADIVREVDAVQYSLGEGPCISAAREGLTVRSGSLGEDQRWPRFGPRAAGLGVHSVLSLPLISGDGVIGAMNVYARSRDAFSTEATHVGELFCAPAAIAVENAQVLAQARRLAANLQVALTSRAVIDQALGIIMSRTGLSSTEAFARLRTRSQTEHTKVVLVAQSVVDTALRRARARHGLDDLAQGAT